MIASSRALVCLALLICVIATASQDNIAAPIRYRVVDVDNPDKGMESKIVVIKLNKEEIPVGATDENGYYDAPLKCNAGERVKFVPINELYYPHNGRCPVRGKVFKVGRIDYVQHLVAKLEIAGKNNDYQVAALLSNEVAVRMSAFDPQNADRIGAVTYQNVGKALGLDETVAREDPAQARVVMTHGLANAVRKFQARKGLSLSGKLDYPTLRTLAGQDIGLFIYSGVDLGVQPIRQDSIDQLSKKIEAVSICGARC